MRIVPITTRTCTVLYDVYRHKDCTDEVFKENHDFFVQVESEDKMLCANVQRNLERGTYNSGPLHRESDPSETCGSAADFFTQRTESLA